MPQGWRDLSISIHLQTAHAEVLSYLSPSAHWPIFPAMWSYSSLKNLKTLNCWISMFNLWWQTLCDVVKSSRNFQFKPPRWSVLWENPQTGGMHYISSLFGINREMRKESYHICGDAKWHGFKTNLVHVSNIWFSYMLKLLEALSSCKHVEKKGLRIVPQVQSLL